MLSVNISDVMALQFSRNSNKQREITTSVLVGFYSLVLWKNPHFSVVSYCKDAFSKFECLVMCFPNCSAE